LPEYANTRACFTCKAFRGEAIEGGTTVTASVFEGGAFPSTTDFSAFMADLKNVLMTGEHGGAKRRDLCQS
jgi:hypothetical protein